MQIKLVRHGESQANVGEMPPHEVGDYNIPLTPKGVEQSLNAGKEIGSDFLSNSLIYYSPLEWA